MALLKSRSSKLHSTPNSVMNLELYRPFHLVPLFQSEPKLGKTEWKTNSPAAEHKGVA